MKTSAKTLLFVTLFFVTASLRAGDTGWQWAKSAGGNSMDYGYAICSDADGNFYVTGTFASDSITFGNFTLTNEGVAEFFLVKYDSEGNVLWAKSAGGSNTFMGDKICAASGNSILTDASGNIYVTGGFRNAVTFDTITLANGGYNNVPDFFIVKYDPAGNALWAVHAGATADAQVNPTGISTDKFGNLYVSGDFQSLHVNTTPASIFGIPLYNSGQTDIFVARFDASGHIIWAKSAGGNYMEQFARISADANGNVYVTGAYYSSQMYFDNIVLTNTMSNDTSTDIFIAKYDTSGNVVWAITAGGGAGDEGDAIKTDMQGNVYVTGIFSGSSITIGTTVLLGNNSCVNMFIVKLDALGNVIWVEGNGENSSNNIGTVVSVDAAGNVYVAGTFAGVLVLPDTFVYSSETLDIYIQKYNSAGDLQYTTCAIGPDYEVVTGVCFDAEGAVFVTGNYASTTVTFGGTVITNATSDRNFDIFIAKLTTPKSAPASVSQLADAGVAFYPNPFSSLFQVQNNTSHTLQFFLCNASGQKIISRELSINANTVDLSLYSPGIYFYRVTSENSVIKKGKIIKQ